MADLEKSSREDIAEGREEEEERNATEIRNKDGTTYDDPTSTRGSSRRTGVSFPNSDKYGRNMGDGEATGRRNGDSSPPLRPSYMGYRSHERRRSVGISAERGGVLGVETAEYDGYNSSEEDIIRNMNNLNKVCTGQTTLLCRLKKKMKSAEQKKDVKNIITLSEKMREYLAINMAMIADAYSIDRYKVARNFVSGVIPNRNVLRDDYDDDNGDQDELNMLIRKKKGGSKRSSLIIVLKKLGFDIDEDAIAVINVVTFIVWMIYGMLRYYAGDAFISIGMQLGIIMVVILVVRTVLSYL